MVQNIDEETSTMNCTVATKSKLHRYNCIRTDIWTWSPL